MNLPPAAYTVEQQKKGRGHAYRVVLAGQPEEMYPGVTGVLGIIEKPALRMWYAKQAIEKAMHTFASKLKKGKLTITAADIDAILEESKKAPEEIKNKAADTGTICHAVFDAVALGQPMPAYPDELKPTVERFLQWYKESEIQVIAGDTDVASRTYKYGGALDAVGMISKDGHESYVLIDFKTSNGIYDEYALQVAAYAQALQETYGLECESAVILRFGKEPKNGVVEFEAKWLKDWRTSFRSFHDALRLKSGMAQEHFREVEVAK